MKKRVFCKNCKHYKIVEGAFYSEEICCANYEVRFSPVTGRYKDYLTCYEANKHCNCKKFEENDSIIKRITNKIKKYL